jgi:hypothetical protein
MDHSAVLILGPVRVAAGCVGAAENYLQTKSAASSVVWAQARASA